METPPARAGHTTYLAYRALAVVAQRLPRFAVDPLATLAGFAMAELSPARRPIVRANLRRVLPDATERELDRCVLQAFDSYARYWAESARLGYVRPREVLSRIQVHGFEPIEAALVERRGAIVALPHLGSWEIGGLWLTLRGFPMTTVVEPLQPVELFEWFKQQRSALGLRILSPEPATTGQLVQTLREGRLVGLVADRDLAGNGVEVELFGEPTTLPAGPAVLALRTGAPLFPAAVYQRAGGRYEGVVLPPIDCKRAHRRLRDDVAVVSQSLARSFEELIRAAPSQWHVFQPNWPADRHG